MLLSKLVKSFIIATLKASSVHYRMRTIRRIAMLVLCCYALTCQIDSNKVSNSKLKLELCNRVKTEIIESTAPPQ